MASTERGCVLIEGDKTGLFCMGEVPDVEEEW